MVAGRSQRQGRRPPVARRVARQGGARQRRRNRGDAQASRQPGRESRRLRFRVAGERRRLAEDRCAGDQGRTDRSRQARTAARRGLDARRARSGLARQGRRLRMDRAAGLARFCAGGKGREGGGERGAVESDGRQVPCRGRGAALRGQVDAAGDDAHRAESDDRRRESEHGAGNDGAGGHALRPEQEGRGGGERQAGRFPARCRPRARPQSDRVAAPAAVLHAEAQRFGDARAAQPEGGPAGARACREGREGRLRRRLQRAGDDRRFPRRRQDQFGRLPEMEVLLLRTHRRASQSRFADRRRHRARRFLRAHHRQSGG